MNKLLKSISLATITALATVLPAMARSNHQHHVSLARAVISTGVQFKINPPECFTKENEGVYGWYWARNREMVVCQENAVNTNEVAWTEEDYDTLRHEVQHLVQDCMDGSLQGQLDSVYRDPIGLAKETLSTSAIHQIVESYGSKGDHTVVMELEAFSVATLNEPLEQVDDIRRYCM